MKVDYFNTFAANSPALSNYVSPKAQKVSKSPSNIKHSPRYSIDYSRKTDKKQTEDKKSRKLKKLENLNQEQKSKRNEKKSYEIDPMYASQISQMRSEISIPALKKQVKISQVAKLQSKVTSQILFLREQKISLMEQLNNISDKKNRCIQMIQAFRNFKEKQFQQQNYLNQKEKENSSININGNYSQKKNENYSPKHNFSKKQHTDTFSSMKKIQESLQSQGASMFKIKDEILKPLLQHPLLIKNMDLKEQLRILSEQMQNQSMSSAQIQTQLTSLMSQNKLIQKQIHMQNQKLQKIQKNRLATFFPKDKKKIEQINYLISQQEKLINKKQDIQKNISSRTIIRTAQDDLWVEQLKQQNIKLMKDVQSLLQIHRKKSKYQHTKIQQLQYLVEQQLNGKKNFVQNLQSFKAKIRKLQETNNSIKNRKNKSYY